MRGGRQPIRPLLLLAVLLAPGLCRAEAEYVFTGEGRCLQPAEARARFEEVLFVLELQRERDPQAPKGAPKRVPTLKLEIDEQACAEKTCLRFQVSSARGAPVLERRYQFSRTDCLSARELLATVLERFLQELPLDSWTEEVETPVEPLKEVPPPYPLSPPEKEKASLDEDGLEKILVSRKRILYSEIQAGLALQGDFGPTGGELQLCPVMNLGLKGHRLWFGPIGRIALPRQLGEGNVLEGQALVGLGYLRVGEGWRLRVGLQGGLAIVNGYGFAAGNKLGALPWMEGVLGVELEVWGLWLGLQLMAAPLDHRLHSIGTGQETSLSVLRAGLSIALPLWDNG